MRLNDTQTSTFTVLPEGTYQFEIENVEYTRSRMNKPMYKVRLRVEGDTDVTVFDNMLEDEKMVWKFVQFFKSIDMYEDDMDLNPSVMNSTVGSIGKVELTVEKNADFGDRNRVKKYLPVVKEQPKKARKKPSTAITEEDLPF